MLQRGTDIRNMKIHHWPDSHLYYGVFIPFCLFNVALNERKLKIHNPTGFTGMTSSASVLTRI